MPLDVASEQMMQQLQQSGAPPIWEAGPEAARAMGASFAPMFGPGPDMARVEEHTLEGADGGSFAVRVLVPSESPGAAIVYFHGGGWVTGHIDEFDTLARLLAARTGAAVVLVNYRKAPEHVFPTAVDDAQIAVEWTAKHLVEIAGSQVPLVVAGDSAGGNLATVTARRSRDAGGPEIALQVLVYPVLDHDFQTPSYVAPENELLLNAKSMQWFWDSYCPPERRADPDASPLRAADLSGLPPCVVLLAEHDVLRSEGERYVEALRDAGVSVTSTIQEGQMHGFFTMVNILPGALAGMEYVAEQAASALAQMDAR